MADKGVVFFNGATDTLAGGPVAEVTGEGPVTFTAEAATGASHLVIEVSFKDTPYAWVVALDTAAADGVVYYGSVPFYARGRVTGSVGAETWKARYVVTKTTAELAAELAAAAAAEAAENYDPCAGLMFQGGAKFEV